MMPDKDGFQVLSELRSNEETKKIPVVVITHLQTESDREKAMELGAEKYIVKTKANFDQVVAETIEVIHLRK